MTGTTHEDRHIFSIILTGLFSMKNVSGKSCRENQYTHFMFSISENRAVFEVVRKNIVLLCMLEKAVWRMCIAHWLHKATNNHLDYVIFLAFSLQ
jgi:hypothetical protein